MSILPTIFADVNNTDLYQKADERWGKDKQIMMLVEETGEMLAKISQFNRGRVTLEELVEEMVDTMMMIDQVFYLLQVPKEMRMDILQKKMKKFRMQVEGVSKQSISEAKAKESR